MDYLISIALLVLISMLFIAYVVYDSDNKK